jgi:DNA polymerase I-like protein with 3'-5' exonuclease and polymerase domains
MLIQIDAAQLEWRVLAWLAGDSVALREINDGIDFHAENQALFGLPSRLIAKIYLFRTIYRGSGWSFANDSNFMGVSQDSDFWDDLNEKFYRKYKGIDQCHLRWGQTVAAKKPIISPFGREWLVDLKPDGSLPWTVLTNYPVQGTGADIMMIARISLMRRLRNLLSTRALLVSTVHDSIVLDCPTEEVPSIGGLAVDVFNDIPGNVKKLYGIDLPCPFPGEVKVGYNLKEMQKLDSFLKG